ncbi:MAG: VWA domain-containing protein [Bacteroidales bacterium]|nr:VWA domain-containing protein [Bacteroidales bacterium]
MDAARFIFADKNILIYGGIMLILLIFIFWIGNLILRQKRKKLGDAHVVSKIISGRSSFRLISAFMVLVLAYSLIVVGQARPQFGSKLQESEQEGSDLIIALDVSNSMNAEDIKPNRLERAKLAILKLLDKLKGDRIGIIIFAGDAYVQLPLTNDYGAARMFIANVSTNLVGKQGTAIGAAIDLAIKSFNFETKAGKALVIITDGENHEEGAIESAKEAVKLGITVHTIGMGRPEGSPIPVYNKYGQKDYRKDKDGRVVVSKLNENMLVQLTNVGKGVYVRASTTNSGLKALYDEIQKLDKQKFESKQFAEYNEQFQYFFAIALLLLMLEMFILPRKPKRLENFSLFKTNFIKSKKKA